MDRLSCFFAALAIALVPRVADAKLRIATSIETFADIAGRIGGDLVEVHSLSRGSMDPHFVEAKPSLEVYLNRADLLLRVGLELEVGWLPPLVLGSRNPKIQPGGPGDLDLSAEIPVLDLPTTAVDRSMGDIHPRGNPHYWLPPDNAAILAREIAARLKVLDPAHATEYEAHLARFLDELKARRAAWEQAAAPLRSLKVVTYHKSWSYLSRWLGLVEIGYVEPKPGIPPPLSHVAQLVGQMRAQSAKVVIMESFYSRSTAQEVARLAAGRLAVLPSDVGAEAAARDYFSLVDAVIKGLLQAARPGG
jgi:zinc/manganese transport system substrate-binding protein